MVPHAVLVPAALHQASLFTEQFVMVSSKSLASDDPMSLAYQYG